MRPDIANAVKELARETWHFTTDSWKKAKHLLRYLKATSDFELTLRPDTHFADDMQREFEITVYADSDWAGCANTSKSTSGVVLRLLSCTVYVASRTQGSIATSSGEAELYAIGAATSEALRIKHLLKEAQLVSQAKIVLLIDSNVAKSITSRIGVGKRCKHREVRYLYVQELVNLGKIIVRKVGARDNLADLLTNYLSGDDTLRFAIALGVERRTSHVSLE